MLNSLYRKLAYYFARKANIWFGDITILQNGNLMVIKEGKLTTFAIDDKSTLAVWNRALSMDEAEALKKSYMPTGLSSYYNFE